MIWRCPKDHCNMKDWLLWPESDVTAEYNSGSGALCHAKPDSPFAILPEGGAERRFYRSAPHKSGVQKVMSKLAEISFESP